MERAQKPEGNEVSCDAAFTRAEFIKRVVKGAAVAGTVIAGPVLVDKFLIPPAFAAGSACALGKMTAFGGADHTTSNAGVADVACNDGTFNGVTVFPDQTLCIGLGDGSLAAGYGCNP